ncbi:LamG domain-containing protein, partial [Longispora fulva]|uniref:LamG domain-containing protein n=2 Tax=Bacteria TaxID=2 RepID=UPI00363A1FFA
GTCATTDTISIEISPECSTLDFDGVNDHIIFGDNYNFPSSAFTLEAWVKPESVQGIRTVLSKRNWRNLNSGGYDLIINNGAPTFRWNGNSVSTSYTVGTDRWYHLAVIFTGSLVELYVDGIKVGNKNVTSRPSANTFPFMIGAMYDNQTPKIPAHYFQGWIEEVRIWKKALSVEQIRFMMNQRIVANGTAVKGEVLPMDVPGSLLWSDLSGYYRLLAEEAATNGGITLDRATNKVDGQLRNIETLQQNSAPLPYISAAPGNWRSRQTWDQKIGTDEEKWWKFPNDLGIDNSTYIDWNIAQISHNIEGYQNITLLGLLQDGQKLDMVGNNPTRVNGNIQAGSG